MNTITGIEVTDRISAPAQIIKGVDSFFKKLINDERDLPFVYLSLSIFLTVVPVAILLFFIKSFFWYVAVVYLVLNGFVFLGPFILMLHNTSHRKLFKVKYRYLNYFIPWVIGIFYGETPETYFAHHVGMHHPENNLSHDLSSTMPKQRDSFADFIKYFSSFLFLGLFDLAAYLKEKKRTKILRRMLLGEMCYVAATIMLLFINWQATVVVFIFPVLFTRFMMMAGNWAQHAFIDAESPGNCYRNSITCINSTYNRRCWNDGYHIGHHLHPSMHWTDLPREFIKNRDSYTKEEALVFQKVDFTGVWFLLMTHNYNRLAKAYVQPDLNSIKSKEEIIAILKKRTAKITTS
jgi:fatty acid desaturase